MNLTKKQLFTAIGIAVLVFAGCLLINMKQNKTRDNAKVFAETASNTKTVASESLTDIIPMDNSIFSYESTTEESTTKEVTTEEETTLNYEELIDFNSKYPYMIKVNRVQNWVMVYGLDKKGHYSIPYKIFVCSTGLHEGDTPLGTFSISDKYEWRLMVDSSYAQYAVRIFGQIMFHSVPYYSPNKNDLEVEEYAKLGQPASLGCIRLNVESVKWIYDNCPKGTVVVVYDSADEKPLLELPKIKNAKAKGPKAGWDPTDPDKNNPWNKKSK